MTKTKYMCKCCGKEYYSYKEKSNYCSHECRIKDNTFIHECEYCGKNFKVTKSIHNKYISGKKKHLYCCKNCSNKAHITRVKKVCMECGIEYEVEKNAKDTQKFCSQICYIQHKNSNSKIEEKICPICNKIFKTYHHSQIYCNKNCRGISIRKRVKCTCNNCGKQFERIKSEVIKNTNNFCSIGCRLDYTRWNINDIDILRNNYRKIKITSIQKMLSRSYSIKAIRSRAVDYGFSKSRIWTHEEEEIVKKNYDKLPISEIKKLLPNRTDASIMHKARSFNMLGYFFINHTYSNDEIDFLKANYLTMTDDELSKHINHSSNGIHQKLYNLSLIRPSEIQKNGYKNLITFMRSRLDVWKQEVRKKYNYTCCLSGKSSNIVIHHCRGFNLLFEETIELLDFPIYDIFSEYNDEQLTYFVNEFLKLQEFYGEYVCITESVHKLFHKNYGYGDNTIEQWNEFSNNYLNGYYKI